jgi:hypothetical protein
MIECNMGYHIRRGDAMPNNPARAALAYFLISGFAAFAVLGSLFSSPSDPDSQVLLGLSVSRWTIAIAFIIAGAVSLALVWYSWRNPAMVADRIRSCLSRDGWLRVLVFFSSGSIFLIGLAVVCFRDWLPVPPGALSHLKPAVLWVMIVATMNILYVIGLNKADDARQRVPALQSNPVDRSSSFTRDFIIGCLVVLLSTSALLAVNLLIGVLVKDRLDTAAVSLIRPSIYQFLPEQVERTRYIASALLFPILASVSWVLAGKLQRGVPRTTNRVAAVTFVGVTSGLAFWLYLSLRAVDFKYIDYLYSDLRLGVIIPSYAAFLLLIGLERRYSSRTWMRIGLGVATALIAILAGLAVASRSLHTSADDYVYSVNFNAYFYAVVQVLLGKTLLVDLSSQYGFYPYFLQPIFHLIGFDVPRLTLVMGSLAIGVYLVLLFLLMRLVKSRLIAACGFISIVWPWLTAIYGFYEPYFQYWPHRVVFPVLILLLGFIYQQSHGRRKQVLGILAFLACGAALLWNLDTGVITFMAWVIYLYWETLLDWRTVGAKESAIVIARRSLAALGTLGATIGLLLLYTYGRSGSIPDLGRLGFYQSIFYQTGYNMLPMPALHPWNLVALTYMAGLCICANSLLKRLRAVGPSDDTGRQGWVNMVFLISILGVGLFTVYQGRSHNHNLMATFWSAFFLTALFADVLWERTVPKIRSGVSSIVAVGLTLLPLPLLLLFVLFAAVPAFLGTLPSSLSSLQSQLGTLTDRIEAEPNPYGERIEFMRQYFLPGEEVPVFSSKYDTIFYLETRTTNPVRAPGWNELFLQSDVNQYESYLENDKPSMFLVSDEFAASCPDLYLSIQKDYAEVAREEDLALFARKPAAR